jgi:hypothetical protein
VRLRRLERTAWLSLTEFRVLCANPAVRRVLGVAGEE